MTAVERIAELKRQRDTARMWAAELEQRLARVEGLAAKWEREGDEDMWAQGPGYAVELREALESE